MSAEFFGEIAARTRLRLGEYLQQHETWPMGQHIFGQFDDEAIVVYQAYNPAIAEYAVHHQKFEGAPGFSMTRMTWIKPNYLWMQYRAGWATKPNQERILAIWLKRSAFEQYLSVSCGSTYNRRKWPTKEDWQAAMQKSPVRLQWDPDHDPAGQKVPGRRALQIGIKGLTTFHDGTDIIRIEDVTALADAGSKFRGGPGLLMPLEEKYTLPADLADHINVRDSIEPRENEKLRAKPDAETTPAADGTTDPMPEAATAQPAGDVEESPKA
eukprot:NODE_2625_length_1023_cov_59.952009_g2606_i0.p1 GENE.NODE_2625_length_1023_cov_59.952009_g2606_i0~~NODE_2625_length_1023_cov_59.952009_g2606_i0.p1  ORF type:complete len:288 (-),score=32.53 NODE_2625_length_1023_cov_59.952009_g2606_i0:160-966(-)